jgi:hypothetical protein
MKNCDHRRNFSSVEDLLPDVFSQDSSLEIGDINLDRANSI